MQVFVVHIGSDDLDEPESFTATSREAAIAEVAERCRDYWEDDGPGGDLPDDDATVIAAYFAHQEANPLRDHRAVAWYAIEETALLRR